MEKLIEFNVGEFRRNVSALMTLKKLKGALSIIRKEMEKMPTDKRKGEDWNNMAEIEYYLQHQVSRKSIYSTAVMTRRD